MESIKDKAAIVGLGVHKFSFDSGMTTRDMACRAVRSALDDAGLTPEDIDGSVKIQEADDDEILVAKSMGIGNIAFWSGCRWGNGASGAMVIRAAVGAAGGSANYIMCFRTITDASTHRDPTYYREMTSSMATQQDFYIPFGHYGDSLPVQNAGRMGMIVRRYMHEYNIGKDDFGCIPVVCRGIRMGAVTR